MQLKIVVSLVVVILSMGVFPIQAQPPVEVFEAPTAQLGYQSTAAANEQSASPTQVATGQPVSSLGLTRSSSGVSPGMGHQPVPGLQGRAEGTIYLLSANNAGQINVYINDQPSGPFTLQLKSDGTNQGILELLLYALEHEQAINIGYGFSQEIVDVEIRK